MIEKEFIVSNKLGIHVRPATLLAKLVLEHLSQVYIEKEDNKVDARSALNIITLEAVHGSKLKFFINGNDEKILLGKIENLFESNFDEVYE